MSAVKVMAGMGLMACALAVGVFALASFGYWGNPFVACIPVAFALGLTGISVWVICKRKSPLGKRGRILTVFVIGTVVMSGLTLNLHIRHERKALQSRAKEFLSRPLPALFNTNILGVYDESGNGNVLIRPRRLIE